MLTMLRAAIEHILYSYMSTHSTCLRKSAKVHAWRQCAGHGNIYIREQILYAHVRARKYTPGANVPDTGTYI
jgi:hypothetical protein